MDKNYIIREFCPPLNIEIVCTKKYWDDMVDRKHPDIKGKEEDVRKTIRDPIEIRKSKFDNTVFLIYNISSNHYLCIVANEEGFMITCYLTNKLKEGELIWRKKTD